MLLASERRGRFFVASASIAAALLVLLAIAARGQAAETVYWDNYKAEPPTIAFANVDGTGGGALNLAGGSLESPEGIAYDSVTNRLFVGSEKGSTPNDHILFINLDGSGAGSLNTGAAPVEFPEGVAVDPATRTIYWVNTGDADSIGWANLDTGQGGLLNTSGATLDNPYKIAIDPVGGKVYWINEDGIGYANANNTGGGGDLNLTGAPPLGSSVTGIVTDPTGGRVYWLESTDKRIGYAALAPGGSGGSIDLAGAPFDGPYGLAFDPSVSRLYWANYSQDEERSNAIGFSSLAGAFGGVTPVTAPLNGPQDPVILKSPSGTGAPVVSRNAKNRAALSCSTGSWAADYAGSFVYQAPRTFAYQWTRNAKPVAGATTAAITAKSGGSYACAVTAANQTGTAAQTSAAVNVKAAKLKLTTKKKAKADVGDLVRFKVKAVNQGDLKPKSAKLCVKLPTAAKDDLKAPKCKKLGLKGRAKKTLTIKVKVKGGADEGTDKLTFQVKGAAGKAAKSKIVIG